MFGGVNLFSSSTHFAGPHAPVPMGGAARGRLRYGIVKPPLALGGNAADTVLTVIVRSVRILSTCSRGARQGVHSCACRRYDKAITTRPKALDHRRPELGARARLPSDRCCLRSHPRTRTWPPSPLSTLLSSCAGGGGGREATGTGTGRVPRISKLNNSALTLFVIRNKRYSHT